MRIVVLGASGMLGHVAALYLKQRYPRRMSLCSRRKTGKPQLDAELMLADLSDTRQVENLVADFRPCVVVNCTGVFGGAVDADRMQRINAALPHILKQCLDSANDGSRLLHVSTDGVFSGLRGAHTEKDMPDAQDLYGKSKSQGEIFGQNHLTMRTSIVGPALRGGGLLDWFLRQKAEVRGFANVFWSGVTTLELAKFIGYAIDHKIQGLVHLVSPEKISKYELLCLFNKVFEKNIRVVRDHSEPNDRSLKSIRTDVGYSVPGYEIMFCELKQWIFAHAGLYREYVKEKNDGFTRQN